MLRVRALRNFSLWSAVGLAACSSPAPPDPSLVIEWMNAYYAAARVERLSPPVASRVFAYGAVAMYESLRPSDSTLGSLAGRLNGLEQIPPPDGRLDWATAVATAQYEVLRSLLADATVSTQLRLRDLSERQQRSRETAGVSRVVRERSAAWGSSVGQAVAEWAARDGYRESRSIPYQPPTGDRFWVNTTAPSEYVAQSVSGAVDYVALRNPSAALDPEVSDERSLLINRPRRPTPQLSIINPTRALEPYWRRLRPFALDSAGQCAPPAPAAYSESRGSQFYREARAVYDASRTLSDEQRRIAFFWADNPGQTGTPPGHWVSILAQVTAQAGLSAGHAAEALVLMTTGMADAFITCWTTKYDHSVVRPVTYIQRVIDREWSSMIVTPPFPEYTSGHSVSSAVAAEILTAIVGDISFTDATHVSIGHAPRTFPSFRSASEEAAISRLYGGIHYPMAIQAGLDQGRCVARQVLERLSTRARAARATAG